MERPEELPCVRRESVSRLLLLAALTAPASNSNAPLAQGDAAVPVAPADRVAAARRRAELVALQALFTAERERPSGTRVRDVLDGKGHRIVLFVARTNGAIESVRTFEPGLTVALYALILDAERRVRLLLIEPKDRRDAYEIDQILFERDGKTAARDHIYGTFTDCADGRLHDRRTVTVFGPQLRVLERSVEFLDDPPGSGSRFTEGCAWEAASPPLPNAPSYLRAHRLETAAREAGVRVEREAGAGPR
jgi:hypothetical protein